MHTGIAAISIKVVIGLATLVFSPSKPTMKPAVTKMPAL